MKKLTREEVLEKISKGDMDLSGLDLSKINLSCTNLHHVNLSNTNLSYANLSCADLGFANLTCTDLCHADLYGADLYHADLCWSNLEFADLTKAKLTGATLERANLFNAILSEKEQIRKGLVLKKRMIGYKKCSGNLIVTLEIPKGAIVFSINNDKCRTNKAKVVDIAHGNKIAYSLCDQSFVYELGKKVEIKDFNTMYNIECSSGIHFFRTESEAEIY